MSQLQIRNASITTIQVRFNDEKTPKSVTPGRARVTSEIGTYAVLKAKEEKYSGVFSGIDNVKIIVEETSVDAKFTVKNDNKKEVVVTYGATIDRIPSGSSCDFHDPGKYTISFPDKSGNSETLRAIATADFPDDVDNATLHVA